MLFQIVYYIKNGEQRIKVMSGESEKKVRNYFAFKYRQVPTEVHELKVRKWTLIGATPRFICGLSFSYFGISDWNRSWR